MLWEEPFGLVNRDAFCTSKEGFLVILYGTGVPAPCLFLSSLRMLQAGLHLLPPVIATSLSTLDTSLISK